MSDCKPIPRGLPFEPMFIRAAAAFAVLLAPALAWAPPWPVVFHFNAVPVLSCDEEWSYGEFHLSFQTTTEEDCAAGGCEFSQMAEGVYLSGARLELDWMWLDDVEWDCIAGIFAVRVVFDEDCGAGCTRVFAYCMDALFVSEASAASGPGQVILIDPIGINASRVVISSCGALIREVTVWLLGDPVDESSWSTIKALY